VCLSDQGACVCFQGYGGAVCEGQVSSFDYSAKLSSVRFATSVITTFENQVLNVGMVRSFGTQYAVKVVFTISDITTTEGKNYVVAQDRTVVIPGGSSSGSFELIILQGQGTFQIAISRIQVECKAGAGVFNCQGDVGSPGVVIVTIARTVCGNGVREGSETCDDGNGEDFDGCSGTCTVEVGYKCSIRTDISGVLPDKCEPATTPDPGQSFVRSSTRLEGMTTAEFIGTVRLAFRKAVASALLLMPSQVVIDIVSERRAQTSVRVDYHVIVAETKTGELAAKMVAIHTDGSLENALRLQGINAFVALPPTAPPPSPSPSPPRTSDWGNQEHAHCVQPNTWDELIQGYKDCAMVLKTGGLGQLMEVDGYETWQCIRDHYCATDPQDPWFCFVYHETNEVFTPWGHNSHLKLVNTSPCPCAPT
jgi:cysteine-rich repeat protein